MWRLMPIGINRHADIHRCVAPSSEVLGKESQKRGSFPCWIEESIWSLIPVGISLDVHCYVLRCALYGRSSLIYLVGSALRIESGFDGVNVSKNVRCAGAHSMFRLLARA